MPSQCMVLQEIVQVVPVVCYVSIIVLQISWPLLGVGGHEYTNHGPVDWGRYCSTVIKGKPSVYPRMQAWPVSIPIPFEAGYDIYEHSKASDVSEPTE